MYFLHLNIKYSKYKIFKNIKIFTQICTLKVTTDRAEMQY